MNDDTAELATYNRAIGGTDAHPVTIDALIGHLNSQLDTVWATAEGRGTLAGAEVFLVSVRELVTLAQSLEGRAAERVEMLRSTTAALAEERPDALSDLYEGVVGDREYGIRPDREEAGHGDA